jgi:RNA polymerase sigma-70 factor, ECF subfamily
MTDLASEAIELIARTSYGKLIALLASRSRNITAAEDALSGALLRALEDWPSSGLPKNPEAWLLTTARRIDVDAWNRAVTAINNIDFLMMLEAEREQIEVAVVPDERVHLLFACAHPAIDPKMHTPLMLQVVLGVSANRIASALLIPAATIGQRLARGKAKIKDAGLCFELPESDELLSRVHAVLAATYAAYTLGNDAAFSDDGQLKGLAKEAIWLARVVVGVLPNEPEAKGLLALILFTEARLTARRNSLNGNYIPLSEQDVQLWDNNLINEAEDLLKTPVKPTKVGRFGLEAAIQAIHVARRDSNVTDWKSIEHLYHGLVIVSPTVGAKIGHAIAISHVENTADALIQIKKIPIEQVKEYAPYWAAKAYLESKTADLSSAKLSYQQAIGLTEDAATRAYLIEKQSLLVTA